MNKRLMRTNLLAPIFLMLITAGTAFADTPNRDIRYQIIAKHSGKCLDIAGGELYNGAAAIQWDCHGGDNQQWTFEPAGGGYFKIIVKHSGKALDVFGGIFSAGSGVVVQQRDYNGSTNQIWSVTDLGNGYYSIVARHSNKALEIKDGSTGNGAWAQQNDYMSGANHQQWRLTPRPCR